MVTWSGTCAQWEPCSCFRFADWSVGESTDNYSATILISDLFRSDFKQTFTCSRFSNVNISFASMTTVIIKHAVWICEENFLLFINQRLIQTINILNKNKSIHLLACLYLYIIYQWPKPDIIWDIPSFPGHHKFITLNISTCGVNCHLNSVFIFEDPKPLMLPKFISFCFFT